MSKQVEDISFEAPIKRIIKQEYPNVSNISKNLLNALSDCTKEFAKILIAGTAEACDKHGTLVVPGDVKESLKKLGYEQFIPTVETHAAIILKKKQEKPKPKESDLSHAELVELQKRAFKDAVEENRRRQSLGY